MYPCDSVTCPFDAAKGLDCYNHCGLGADEDRDREEL